MDEPNLLQETYGVNITAYYNDLSNNMNELARKAVNSMSEELKKLDIFDEQALEKGIGYFDKRLSHTLNKNLDVLENYAKENLFNIEDLRPIFEVKKNSAKKHDQNMGEIKNQLDKEFQDYRKQRNLQMLDKVIKESREKFQQSSENIENQYQLSEIPKKIAKSEAKLKNLENYMATLRDNSQKIDDLLDKLTE